MEVLCNKQLGLFCGLLRFCLFCKDRVQMHMISVDPIDNNSCKSVYVLTFDMNS